MILGFQDVLDECELYDVELAGYPYTWDRGRRTERWVKIKLDKTLAIRSFNNIFTEFKPTNLEISTSNHCPIFLEPTKVIHLV